MPYSASGTYDNALQVQANSQRLTSVDTAQRSYTSSLRDLRHKRWALPEDEVLLIDPAFGTGLQFDVKVQEQVGKTGLALEVRKAMSVVSRCISLFEAKRETLKVGRM